MPHSTADAVAAIPALMSSEAAAKLLGKETSYVRKLVRTGRLRASRVGKDLLIRGVDLLAFLDAHPSHDAEGRALGCEGKPLRLEAMHLFGRTRGSSGQDGNAA